MNKSAFWKSILLTVLIAGALDLAGAIFSFKASRGTFPVNILKYIAGGVLKGKAMDGGASMHWLGAALHFTITFIWTFLFYVLYPKIKLLQKNYWINAVVYGVIIWSFMNLIVLPLSAWKAPISFENKKEILKAIMILVICVALPIAYRASKYFKAR